MEETHVFVLGSKCNTGYRCKIISIIKAILGVKKEYRIEELQMGRITCLDGICGEMIKYKSQSLYPLVRV